MSGKNMSENWSERLRAALQDKGWSQMELKRRTGLEYNSINKYVTGGVKQPRGKTLEKIAQCLGVDYLWLLTGNETENTTPVMGYVGAGHEIYSIGENEIERVETPPHSSKSLIAVIVRGDSARPIYDPGTVLYYSEMNPPMEMINHQAICRINDGRVMLKIVKHGSEKGLFNLQSINLSYPDITDVELDWAAPIEWTKRSV